MELKLEFCNKHIKMVNKKRPICPECLKDKGFDMIEHEDKLYLNSKYLLHFINLLNTHNQLKKDYAWSLETLNTISTLAYQLSHCSSKQTDNEEELQINNRIAQALQAVGASINDFILAAIVEKENRDNNES